MKLYLDEPGSAEMMRFLKEHHPVNIVLSSLSRVEIQSVLVRLENTHHLPAGEVTRIAVAIERIWPEITEIPINEKLIKTAAQLVPAHKLRTLDAMQLAAALTAPLSEQSIFVSSDKQLLVAARAEGFVTFDPLAAL